MRATFISGTEYCGRQTPKFDGHCGSRPPYLHAWSRPLRSCAANDRTFADFLDHSTGTKRGHAAKPSAEEKAQELIERTSHLLKAAEAALKEVRQREPTHPRHHPASTTPAKKGEDPPPSIRTVTSLPLAWESDLNEPEYPTSRSTFGGPGSRSVDTAGGTTHWQSGSSSLESKTSTGPADLGLHSWFGGKVNAGTAASLSQAQPKTVSVAVLERSELPSSLMFAPPEAPHESGAANIFPESLMIRFESDMPISTEETSVWQEMTGASAIPESCVAFEASVPEIKESYKVERSSGEEFGPDGYWYRWTEIHGENEQGTIRWSERWWEASDWKGTKELGAEKWGFNADGDAWRETWRESVGIDASTGQPTVERAAHKWAKAGGGREWEEKWGEAYWSGGKADKWADKWGKEGGDVWHERWGETYDGFGGCVKWTDRWAEREAPNGLDKWGDKWEERFADGRGTKQGETWSESGDGSRYQRWWGENHLGDGHVQKFGHSTTGEHWDLTERMDTYYNPIPHFGYDLALAHSPQLRGVPTLPRDAPLLSDDDGDRAKGAKPKKKGGKKVPPPSGLDALFG